MTGWVIGLFLGVLTVLLVLLLAGLGFVSRRADDESERMHEDLRRKEWTDD